MTSLYLVVAEVEAPVAKLLGPAPLDGTSRRRGLLNRLPDKGVGGVVFAGVGVQRAHFTQVGGGLRDTGEGGGVVNVLECVFDGDEVRM